MTVILPTEMDALQLVAFRMDLSVLLLEMVAIAQAALEGLTLTQHTLLARHVQITIAKPAIQRENALFAIVRIIE